MRVTEDSSDCLSSGCKSCPESKKCIREVWALRA